MDEWMCERINSWMNANVYGTCRVFYYPGAKFDKSLLIQSFIMITIQLVLLKVALDHRPSPSSKGGEAALPFAGGSASRNESPTRPYNFWQWRSHRPYGPPSSQSV